MADERSLPSAVKVTPCSAADEPTLRGIEFVLGQSLDLVTVTTTVSPVEVEAIIKVLGSDEIEKVPVAFTVYGANRDTDDNIIAIRNKDAMCLE